MNGRDITKLVNDGYQIFRLREEDKSIWFVHTPSESTFHTGWSLFSRHKTKKAAKDTFAVLMKDSKSVEG